MPLFTKNDKTIFFAHIPKTAGTSFLSFFKKNGYKKTYPNKNTRKNSHGLCSAWHAHKTDPRLIKELGKRKDIVYKFAIVRDPMERMVSNFFWAKLNTESVEPIIRRTPTDKEEQHFHEWSSNMFNEYPTNNCILYNHIRPMVEFIHEGMEIFWFGEWNAIIQKLKTFHPNIQHPLEKVNSTTRPLGWKPNVETQDLVREFYKQDYIFLQSLGRNLL
jgi:hypothetical protein